MLPRIHWLDERFGPAAQRAHQAVSYVGSPVQAFCDLLEVRWLLSEQQGADVGDEPALEALSASVVPVDSAANLGFVDQATVELPEIASSQEDPHGPSRMVD